MNQELNHRMAELLADQSAFAYCVITDTQGSAPRKKGAAMLVLPEGRSIGTIGGGKSEKIIIDKARTAIRAKQSTLIHLGLDEDAEMICGGKISVFIQVFGEPNALYIFGAGHVGKAVAKLAVPLGFNVHMLDERKDVLDASDIPSLSKHHGTIESLVGVPAFDSDTYLIVTTHDHKSDIEILLSLCRKNYAYLGMIGSKKKVAKAKASLQSAKVPEEVINKIDMPIGLEIGAQGPEEIAVSILAGIIAAKNRL